MKLDQLINQTIESRALRKFVSIPLKTHDLKYCELEILYLLRNKQTFQPSHITATLQQESGSVSRALSNLQQKKLIVYTNDHEDRRRVFVTITTIGVQLLNKIESSVDQ